MANAIDALGDSRLVSESRSLVSRYVEEVVLAHDLCPWAAPALRRDVVRIEVVCDVISAIFEGSPAAAAVRRRLAVTPPDTELVLVVLPCAALGRLEFDRFLREVRTGLARGDGELDFALAAFHPAARPDQRTPETLIPFLRRSPIPLIQAVRSSTMARIAPVDRAGTSFLDPSDLLAHLDEKPPISLRERVARDNERTVARLGVDVLCRQLDTLGALAIDVLDAVAPLEVGRALWR